MERIITSEGEPSSIELALYVISRLGLDPKDLEPVDELAAIQRSHGEEPGRPCAAGYLAKKTMKGGRCVDALVGPRH